MTIPTPVTIRRAIADDAELLVELGAQTFSSAFAKDNSPADMAAYLATNFTLERLSDELADQGAIFFIAEVDQLAAGYAKLKQGDAPDCVSGDNPIEIERIYTLPEHFGKGVGEALIKACLEEAKQRGFQSVWLGVWERNDRALAFYRKFGFREAGDKIFQLGSDPQIDKVMERAL
jgi:ribosomal protein S18 acetylase RimI-like enzyme